MGTRKFINFTAFIAILSVYFVLIVGKNDENDLRLTLAERKALDELKSQVSGEIKEDFMKSDFYLIRYLRRANLNVQSAKNKVLQTLAWREENKMSTIVDEDFSDLEPDFHSKIGGKDKKGRPVVELDLGDWDLRAAVIQGKIRRVRRYFYSLTEQNIGTIFDDQKQGKPITRYIVLFDLDGLNRGQHGCSMCIFAMIQWVAEFDQFYPDFTDEIIFINGPTLGVMAYGGVRTVASPGLNSQVKFYDGNKARWMKYLDEIIDRDQRSPRYGGNSTKI